MALAVLTVGAAGIVALQKASVFGNMRARNLTTANAIAASWAERLRTDALQWTPTRDITNTTWLSAVAADFPTVSPPEGEWSRPAPVPALFISPQANVQGLDTFTDTEAVFCTNIRLRQLLPSVVRAEIRVFWLRTLAGGTPNGAPLCDGSTGYIDAVSASPTRFHFVYATTSLMRAP